LGYNRKRALHYKHKLFSKEGHYQTHGMSYESILRDNYWYFTNKYVYYNDSNGNVGMYLEGLVYNLLRVVLENMNMIFDHVPTPVERLVGAMLPKEVYRALGNMGTLDLVKSFLDSTNSYFMMSIHWYIPCSVNYPKCSVIFRILSVEPWIVMIISIMITAISTTLFGRYICTFEWQVYKTLTRWLTNLWAVIVGVSVSTMQRTP
jgi:hypothetical protein